MSIFLLVVVFGGVVLFEVPGLIRQEYWRELIVFSLFLSLGFTLYLLRIMGVEFPSITKVLIELIKPLLNFIE